MSIQLSQDRRSSVCLSNAIRISKEAFALMAAEEKEDTPKKVTTRNPIRVLWLTRFRGYRVTTTRRTPRVNWHGQIRYASQWTLER